MPLTSDMKQAKKGELLLLQRNDRGEVFEYRIGDHLLHDIRTNAGWARGGDYHDAVSYSKMRYGSGRWIIEDPDGSRREVVQTKDQILEMPPRVSHYFVAIEDCAFDEWLDAPGPFVSFYNQGMRDKVAKINEERARVIAARRQ